MAMLADLIELDTHKHTHTAAVVVAAIGAVLEQLTVPATPAGDQQLLQLAHQQPGQRVWAIEGTGGDGAGLTRFLQAQAEQVLELDRPRRTARRHGAKSDAPDAIRAAREAWAATSSPSQRPPATVPRCRCGWPPAARRSRLPAMPAPAACAGGRRS